MKVLLIAAVPAILALLLWALIDLESFILVGVLSSILFPASLAKPGGTNVDAADLLLVIGIVSWLINNAVGNAPDPWIRRNPLILATVLFLAMNGASVAWSVKPHSTIVFAIQLSELVIAYPLVFASLPTSIARLRRGLYLFVVVTAGLSVVTLLVFAGSAHARQTGTYLPGFNKNALGSFLAAGVVLGYSLWLSARGARFRWVLVATSLLDVTGAIASGSRGALLGGAIALLCVASLLRRQRVTGRVIAFGLAIAIGVLYFTVVAPNRARSTQASGAYDSSQVRSISWRDAWHKIEARPWLGTGARTYSDSISLGGTIPDPNNLFLLTWAELGIPGLLALGFLLSRFAQLIVRARRLSEDAAAVAIGAGAVAISLLVHFQVDVSWSRGETTLEFAMMGVMLAVLRLSPRARDGGSNTPFVEVSETMADLIPLTV